MKRANYRKGFTLIELLSVIVILGIITGFSIPVVLDLLQKNKQQKYTYHEEIVKRGIDLYVDQYSQTFEENQGSCSCYKIPYQALLDENLVKEADVTCDSNKDNETSGLIIAYPLGENKRNFRYDYYLTCKDKTTSTIIHQSVPAPSGCCGVNGKFVISEIILKLNDVNGQIYPQSDSNWTKENVYQEFKATSPYMSPIQGYEYSVDNGKTWTFISENNFTFSEEINAEVQVRAVDKDNNKSTAVSYFVRIDKNSPTLSFSHAGGNYSKLISVDVTASDTTFDRMSINVYKNGVLDTTKSIESTTEKKVTINLDTIGTWEIKAKASDQVGYVQTTEPLDSEGWTHHTYIIVTQQYVYSYANHFSEITGGWYVSRAENDGQGCYTSSGVGSYSAPYIYLRTECGWVPVEWANINIEHRNAIDLSPYSKMTVVYSYRRYVSWDGVPIYCSANMTAGGRGMGLPETGGNMRSNTMNISNINGFQHISFSNNNSNNSNTCELKVWEILLHN